MARVDRTVKLFKVKSFVIVPMVVLPKLVKPPAFWQMKRPLIC